MMRNIVFDLEGVVKFTPRGGVIYFLLKKEARLFANQDNLCYFCDAFLNYLMQIGRFVCLVLSA